MAQNVSSAMAELQNLINAANWHREHCMGPCNVALYLLGLTAKRLVNHCWLSERAEARRLIHETGWNL